MNDTVIGNDRRKDKPKIKELKGGTRYKENPTVREGSEYAFQHILDKMKDCNRMLAHKLIPMIVANVGSGKVRLHRDEVVEVYETNIRTFYDAISDLKDREILFNSFDPNIYWINKGKKL